MSLDYAAFHSLKYVERALNESWCMRSTPSVCTSAVAGPRYVVTGLRVSAEAAAAASCAENMCWHGAHMIPFLIRRHAVRTLVEIGVCTGMSSVNVIEQFGLPNGPRQPTLSKYYLVDPWGGARCKPGCACAAHINKIARTWPDVVKPLRGYSVPMARRIPNASLE